MDVDFPSESVLVAVTSLIILTDLGVVTKVITLTMLTGMGDMIDVLTLVILIDIVDVIGRSPIYNICMSHLSRDHIISAYPTCHVIAYHIYMSHLSRDCISHLHVLLVT